MSETNLDIKDLPLLPTVSDDDRFLMTKASENHTATALTVANFKQQLGAITGITKKMVEDVLKGDITSHSHSWSGITGKPTTLSGYGITDVYSKTDSDGRYIKKIGDKITGKLFLEATNNTNAYGGALEIREYGNVLASQSAWLYSPSITFHWGNRYAKRFGMRADGQFAIDDKPILTTDNYNKYAPSLSGNGASGTWGINITGNAATLGGYASNWFIRRGSWYNDNDIDYNAINYIYNNGLTVSPIHTPNYKGQSNHPFFDYGQMLNFDFGTMFPFRMAVRYNTGDVYLQTAGYKISGYNYKDSPTGWKKMAFISDNVASATKLKNARTIWGQSFDGTGNVSGTLYSNGTNNSQNNTWIQNGSIELFGGTPYIDFHFNNSTADYTSRIIESSSGRLTIWNALSVNTTGSSYTLQVAGTGYFLNSVTMGSTLNVSSDIRSIGGTINAGESIDKEYGFINVTRPNNINNAACFSWVRAGVMPFALGFNTSDQIVMGGGNRNRIVTPWITIGSNTASVPGSFSVGAVLSGSRITSGWDSGQAGSVSCSNWFRSSGATGWHNQTYGGGIYMNDSVYVRTYNRKPLYAESGFAYGINGHNVGLKLYNTDNIGINLANNSYTWGLYSNNNGNMYIGRRNGNVDDASGNYYLVIGAGTMTYSGNFVATGEVTAYGASDIRLKTNQQKLSGMDFLKKINTYEFDWTEEALTLKTDKNRRDAGVFAQELKAIAPHFVNDNMWGKGYLGVDYNKFTPYLIAGLNELDDEVSQLKKQVSDLQSQLSLYLTSH